jgi:alpha-mannosidase II
MGILTRIMKRYLAFMGSAMFCVVCFSLYLMLESTTLGTRGMDVGENDLTSIEVKIKAIESDLQRNHKTINMIKDAVRDIAKGDMDSLAKLQDALQIQLDKPVKSRVSSTSSHTVVSMKQLNTSSLKKTIVKVPMETCSIATKTPPKPEYQMQDVFDTLPFDNPDGGLWKQGYNVHYEESRFTDKPLLVFVVPHSHNDPGWLKTFERYYLDQTRHILDNMVDKLEQYPKMRFIYAEISFFSIWWGDISNAKKERVKKLLAENRLEIVTGGWVMNDEANTHYYAILDQLIEGNTWLLNQVGVIPQSGWAIDPFGHSPTMAYLLKRMGFSNMLIQRVHYSIKKYMAQHAALEFNWRQVWDHDGSTDMLCHMMPFYSYDVPHTCGPDPRTCCQYDFKRLPGGRVNCPWKVAPVPINDNNVAQKAEILLDQYRKKSVLYGTNNVVLAPVGDDFRYDKGVEWDQQYLNYQALFDYMNSRSDWHVKAQFGTLTDYFNAVHEREGVSHSAMTNHPTLSGDFYTYADRDDHYWSGYYTSRPFYKRLDRILEAHLRGAEILFSQAQTLATRHHSSTFPSTILMKFIVGSRRNLGLFQHHDGITGTAKDFVVADYGAKMLRAIKDTKDVIRRSAHYLLTEDKSKYTHSESNPLFDLDELRKSHDSLPERTVMTLTSTAK